MIWKIWILLWVWGSPQHSGVEARVSLRPSNKLGMGGIPVRSRTVIGLRVSNLPVANLPGPDEVSLRAAAFLHLASGS